MPSRRRADPVEGRSALGHWCAEPDASGPEILGPAVRHTLAEFAAAHPGNAVELRVPPFGAVQCVAGGRHRRGTPPNVVETDARTWLELFTGRRSWAAATESGRIAASGTRADLSELLPPAGAAG